MQSSMKSYPKDFIAYPKPAFGKFHRIFKTTSIYAYKSKAEYSNFKISFITLLSIKIKRKPE
ncbi:hypothetical protein [Leptospira santarosai]|uniref:Uncharacterized protein n=1 Tax=Leptospira santarosai str. ZUN179 TaxID=1049985 RepID=M6V721_9LEPT|nr:hypothetical protein [Leptospira santarosai]EMO13151.1 hypothetical protein LEP1GSC165_0192 [Leptospira santarosai str. CBC523]EMO45298.1 hypothetical protein LEP1GSC187_0756 [Leptospira santarosai str. ZUN179]MDI7184522.1 hypothetical protein [Leptospira santarosai]